MAKKLKIGVIGCGTIGTVHAERYAKSPQAELVYLVDLIEDKAKKLAAATGAKSVATDYRKILAEVDAVSVCLPNDLHCPVSVEALKAGKGVLCEKPIALNLSQAREMQAEAKKAGRLLAIGVVNRFNDNVNLVKDAISSGKLGQVYHSSFMFKAYRSIPGLGGWFTTKKRAGGGVMIDWGVHFIDLVLYCLGFPEPRKAFGVAHARLGKNLKEYAYLSMWAGPPDFAGVCDVEEWVSGTVTTSGPTLSFEGAWAQNVDGPAMYLDFLGDKGGIRLNYGQGFTLYSNQDGTLYETKQQRIPTDMFQKEIDCFVDCALSGKPSPAHIDTVIASQKVIDGIYASAEKGAEVAL
jgi:predicted dehydrogenase